MSRFCFRDIISRFSRFKLGFPLRGTQLVGSGSCRGFSVVSLSFSLRNVYQNTAARKFQFSEQLSQFLSGMSRVHIPQFDKPELPPGLSWDTSSNQATVSSFCTISKLSVTLTLQLYGVHPDILTHTVDRGVYQTYSSRFLAAVVWVRSQNSPRRICI